MNVLNLILLHSSYSVFLTVLLHHCWFVWIQVNWMCFFYSSCVFCFTHNKPRAHRNQCISIVIMLFERLKKRARSEQYWIDFSLRQTIELNENSFSLILPNAIVVADVIVTWKINRRRQYSSEKKEEKKNRKHNSKTNRLNFID